LKIVIVYDYFSNDELKEEDSGNLFLLVNRFSGRDAKKRHNKF